MEEITIRGTRAQQNLMEWSRCVAECHSSGMSVTRWCSEHNINPELFTPVSVRSRTLEKH